MTDTFDGGVPVDIAPASDAPRGISWDNRDYTKPDGLDGLDGKWKNEGKNARKLRDSLNKARDAVAAKLSGGEQPKDEKKTKAVSKDSVEDRKLKREALVRANEKAKQNAEPTSKELRGDDAREIRRQLRARYPNADLGAMMTQMEHWDESFKKDPHGTRESIMKAYLQVSPENMGKAGKAEDAKGINGALKRALADSKDLAELEPWIEKHGQRFPEMLRLADTCRPAKRATDSR